jgi:hypothetical protein
MNKPIHAYVAPRMNMPDVCAVCWLSREAAIHVSKWITVVEENSYMTNQQVDIARLRQWLTTPGVLLIVCTKDTWRAMHHEIDVLRLFLGCNPDPIRATIVCRFTTKEMLKLICTNEYALQFVQRRFGLVYRLCFGG